MKTLIASCFIAAALTYGATAAAGPRAHSHQRVATVFVGDLDLAVERDARALYERIGYAARSICTAEVLSFDARRALNRRQCIEKAIADAVGRAGAPLVMAIHLQQREQVARL